MKYAKLILIVCCDDMIVAKNLNKDNAHDSMSCDGVHAVIHKTVEISQKDYEKEVIHRGPDNRD